LLKRGENPEQVRVGRISALPSQRKTRRTSDPYSSRAGRDVFENVLKPAHAKLLSRYIAQNVQRLWEQPMVACRSRESASEGGGRCCRRSACLSDLGRFYSEPRERSSRYNGGRLTIGRPVLDWAGVPYSKGAIMKVALRQVIVLAALFAAGRRPRPGCRCVTT